MSSVGPAGAQSSAHDTRWKWALFALCALLGIDVMTVAIGDLGLGGRQIYGFYDSGQVTTPGMAYIETIVQVQPGGATERAGLRTGDRVDLREQPFATRVYMMAQPVTTEPLKIIAIRGGKRISTTLVPSPAGDNGLKLATIILPMVTCLWCLGCVALIAARRWWSLEGRVLAVVLTSVGVGMTETPDVSFPSPAISLIAWSAIWFLWFTSFALIVWLASRIGARSPWRAVLQWTGYAAIGSMVGAVALCDFGLVTLLVDPGTFAWINPIMSNAAIGVALLVLIIACAAVGSSPKLEKPRAAWLLLPVPISLVGSQLMQNLQAFAQSWVWNITFAIMSDVFLLAGAFFVTYALLKRRVLDAGFLLSRTLVFGIVSLIVVAAFVLLEWLLGLTVAGASHAPGLIANAALALVLGVSMNFIHRRVDSFVDAVFFRKRYDDERALRDFSHEAAFVTEREVLLDQAVDKIRSHTDARNAALLVLDNDLYKAARGFGDVPGAVDENDPAILALKARHKPFDPHPYTTEMRGDLAVPMVARGHLVGVLLFGERASGEAYSPDEIEALSEFAHGVGSALDGLGNGARESSSAALLGTIDSRLENIERLLSDRPT
ncbi:MAG TPA: GAF domain-containing protein [Candidatus Eremiobacteraceae bacterium]|nr:GAF domain-containing protein [Candidatus Eremiobacteraceae bacterium]